MTAWWHGSIASTSAALRLALVALVLAALVLGVLAWRLRAGARQGQRPPGAALAALTALTVFLTFDLIVFGAFTRLTDSGLGCPDWPGCYGQATPWAASGDISAAEAALPSGPVTHTKAWIEMIHRYLAMTVGALIVVIAAWSWRLRRALPHAWGWGLLTLAWVLVQGLFGKYTVTLKLYPAIVTLHWLGALLLLALLLVQHQSFVNRPLPGPAPLVRGMRWVLGLLVVQAALGAWVSTNYAVVACSGFPQCNGQWWPAMDWAGGFALRRELGQGAAGGLISMEAMVAIHMAHRLFALLAVGAVLAWCWRAWRCANLRRHARLLALLVAAQVATGLANVLLDWPLAAALAHSAGAAALVGVVVAMVLRLQVSVPIGVGAVWPPARRRHPQEQAV